MVPETWWGEVCPEVHGHSVPAGNLANVEKGGKDGGHLRQHPAIYTQYKKKHVQDGDTQPSSSTKATFFQPRKVPSYALNSSKFRELLLSFIVSNSLPLRISESLSFRQFVSHLNPTTLVIRQTTITRDLQRIICIHKAMLQLELRQHVVQGGRIS